MHEKRTSFTGSIGFVLAAAGSAVGLGNIWRFPYLAAKDGGGLFLVVYIVLALTFGFALLTTEIAIGRKTKQSPLTAYARLRQGKIWNGLGIIACIVPFLIMPYYCVIGGWVLKYFLTFLTGHGKEAAGDEFFSQFISGQFESVVMTTLFLIIVAYIIYRGVNKGIEASSKIIMPALLVMIIGIAIFSLTLRHSDETGQVRNGLEGFQIFVIPNFDSMTLKSFFTTVMDAMGQLFYSLSVAMGIMIAYGSYVKDDANLARSINQIEIFDTVVAFLAGTMIIPAVYVFMDTEGMSQGPSLMFVSLPKIFAEMGTMGDVIGTIFFAMVLFAAFTSAISILEAIVSSLIDQFHITRKKATLSESFLALMIAIVVCLGYGPLFFDIVLPNGTHAQILDIMDYISNNFFMPIVAIATCVLVGWFLSPKMILDEVEKGGAKLGRKRLYTIMIKYIAPILLVILFLKSIGVLTVI